MAAGRDSVAWKNEIQMADERWPTRFPARGQKTVNFSPLKLLRKNVEKPEVSDQKPGRGLADL